MKRALAIAVALALIGSASPAASQGSRPPTLSPSARASIDRTLYESVVSANDLRRADERSDRLRHQIDDLSVELAAARRLGATAQATADALTARIAALQEEYVERAAEQSRVLEQEIANFRRVLDDIVSTPEGEAALRQFNAGDAVGAVAAWNRLNLARDRVILTRAGIDMARGRRIGAMLMLKGRERGEAFSTDDVIKGFEEVTRLDPNEQWDWVELARLYVSAGRNEDASRAANQAASTAASLRQRAVALAEIGNVLWAAKDFAGAKRRYEESLAAMEQLSAAAPQDGGLRRDVAVSAYQLGQALVDLKDVAGALSRFTQALTISRELELKDPSDQARRYVSMTTTGLGQALAASGRLKEARDRFTESLAIDRDLAKRNPTSVDAFSDLTVTLYELGTLLEKSDDGAGARAHFAESVAISEQLARADPANRRTAEALRLNAESLARVYLGMGDLPGAATALTRLGDVELSLSNAASARGHYEMALTVWREAMSRNAGSPTLPLDVNTALRRLGRAFQASGDLDGALNQYRAAAANGKQLAAADPSVGVRLDLMASLVAAGELLEKRDDVMGARAQYEESLEIARTLASRSPSNADAQRILWISMSKVARLPGSVVTWRDVLTTMEDAGRRGMLVPSDQELLDEARRNTGARQP
jgi:tetratricopeptide (TPR) repeat protein